MGIGFRRVVVMTLLLFISIRHYPLIVLFQSSFRSSIRQLDTGRDSISPQNLLQFSFYLPVHFLQSPCLFLVWIKLVLPFALDGSVVSPCNLFLTSTRYPSYHSTYYLSTCCLERQVSLGEIVYCWVVHGHSLEVN